MNGRKAFWFGITGVLFFVTATILGGFQVPNYSHLSQLISESYAMGTPYGLHLRFGGFLPSGALLALFALFALRSLPSSPATKTGFTGIGVFYGLATVVVSLFPCDEGCNKEFVNPSLSQLIHNLAGFLTYLLVPASLLLLGITARKWNHAGFLSNAGIVCGLTAMLFTGLLFSAPVGSYAGLYQRMIEGAVLCWIVLCCFYLRRLQQSGPVQKR